MQQILKRLKEALHRENGSSAAVLSLNTCTSHHIKDHLETPQQCKGLGSLLVGWLQGGGNQPRT